MQLQLRQATDNVFPRYDSGVSLTRVGTYGWTGPSFDAPLSPATATRHQCPYCGEPLVQVLHGQEEGGRVQQEFDACVILLDMLPPTHAIVGCLDCEQGFTVLKEPTDGR